MMLRIAGGLYFARLRFSIEKLQRIQQGLSDPHIKKDAHPPKIADVRLIYYILHFLYLINTYTDFNALFLKGVIFALLASIG